jgi:hypothetical protein
VVEGYAGCPTYSQARAWADAHELEASACGWIWVVMFRFDHR